MERKRGGSPSSQRTKAKPATLELSPDRAFVLHLDVRSRPPSRLAGRIEHITSGRVARVTSLRELLAFLAEVLLNEAPCEQEERTPLAPDYARGAGATSARASAGAAAAGEPARTAPPGRPRRVE